MQRRGNRENEEEKEKLSFISENKFMNAGMTQIFEEVRS